MNYSKIQGDLIKDFINGNEDKWTHTSCRYKGYVYDILIYEGIIGYVIPTEYFFLNIDMINKMDSAKDFIEKSLAIKDIYPESYFRRKSEKLVNGKAKKLVEYELNLGLDTAYFDEKLFGKFARKSEDIQVYIRNPKDIASIFEDDIPIGIICPINTNK